MKHATDIPTLRIRIGKLQSRKAELTAALAGIDTRYLVSQQAYDDQAELSECSDLLDRLQGELTLAEQIEADNHRREGEELVTELTMRFEKLDQAEAQHQAELDRLASARKQLAEEAKAQLHTHPERLAALLRSCVPYEDEVTQLVQANLKYREQLESVGGPLEIERFVADYGIPRVLLRVDLDRPYSDRDAVSGKTLAEWLAAYIERQRP